MTIDFAAMPTNQWVEVDVPLTSPTDTPYKTNWSGGVFDTTRGQLIVYERYVDPDNADFFYSNAFWGFDADQGHWVLRAQSPWHNTGYCSLTNASQSFDFPWDRHPYNQMAFDPASATLYLYGGPSYNCFGTDDTSHVWMLHTADDTWTSVQPASLPLVYNFYEGTFALDAPRSRIVSSVITSSSLWQYDLAQPAWSALAAPEALAQHQDQLGLVYASVPQKLLAFGGHVYGQPGSAETYEMDATTDTWQLVAGSAPPGRFSMGLAYSPDHDLALLYGGYSADHVLLDDTWIFDFATDTWRQVDTAGPHVDNVDVPLVYDSKHRVFLVPAAPEGDYTYSQLWLFKPDAATLPEPPVMTSHRGCNAGGSAGLGTAIAILAGLRRRTRAAVLALALAGCFNVRRAEVPLAGNPAGAECFATCQQTQPEARIVDCVAACPGAVRDRCDGVACAQERHLSKGKTARLLLVGGLVACATASGTSSGGAQ